MWSSFLNKISIWLRFYLSSYSHTFDTSDSEIHVILSSGNTYVKKYSHIVVRPFMLSKMGLSGSQLFFHYFLKNGFFDAAYKSVEKSGLRFLVPLEREICVPVTEVRAILFKDKPRRLKIYKKAFSLQEHLSYLSPHFIHSITPDKRQDDDSKSVAKKTERKVKISGISPQDLIHGFEAEKNSHHHSKVVPSGISPQDLVQGLKSKTGLKPIQAKLSDKKDTLNGEHSGDKANRTLGKDGHINDKNVSTDYKPYVGRQDTLS